VDWQADLREVAAASWRSVLQHVTDAVLVIDRDRNLQLVNQAARQLLGYEAREQVEGRCRLTTRGVDCELTCPVTFAIQNSMEAVEGFAAEYRRRDGGTVALEVTVVRLTDSSGEHVGHVELLRPARPDPGFFLAGTSQRAFELRRRLTELARSDGPLVLVGEEPACADVAQAVHRFAGLQPGAFRRWGGTWEGDPSWPPGTVYVAGEPLGPVLAALPGFRVIASVADAAAVPAGVPVTVVQLPALGERREDLPTMVTAWVRRLRPGLRVAPEALESLCRLALDRGLVRLHEVLLVAVAVAADRLEAQDLPVRCYSTELVHQLLEKSDPLGALEKELLREVLERCSWRMQEAADRLGISRVTLWRKLREHGICKE
jgi:PAS domain S-box-containing protein